MGVFFFINLEGNYSAGMLCDWTLLIGLSWPHFHTDLIMQCSKQLTKE
jgi:hypothetical protein